MLDDFCNQYHGGEWVYIEPHIWGSWMPQESWMTSTPEFGIVRRMTLQLAVPSVPRLWRIQTNSLKDGSVLKFAPLAFGSEESPRCKNKHVFGELVCL